MNELPDNFRPMLSGAIKKPEDLQKLNYPIIASPKLDGIRVLIHPELGLVTRSLKPVRNKFLHRYIQKLMYGYPNMAGLDGEITIGGVKDVTAEDVFNKTTRAVMSFGGKPKVTFWVFDYFILPKAAYLNRLRIVRNDILPKIERLSDPQPTIQFYLIRSRICPNKEQLLHYEDYCLEEGYEGVMIRDPDKPYKYGRSALSKRQQHLIKMKRFTDAEAEIIGYEELMHNSNEQTHDAFGLADRSSAKAGKTSGGTLGALVVKGISVRFINTTFKIGTGFDQSLRARIWKTREEILHKTITYKYQDCGAIDAPRFPVFQRFREAE